MNSAEALEAAERLMDEHDSNVQFHPMAPQFPIMGVEDAYAVQREYVRLQRERRGADRAGYKVGLTSLRMQAMCRIDSPVAGIVFADRVHGSGARLRAKDYGRVGLEFEIAARLRADLGADGRPVSLEAAAAAIGAIAPAIEIVDDRRCDYATLDVLSLIADNSWNAGIVQGAFQPSWPDLAEIEGVISRDGVVADRGYGREVLGHPLHSVAWLAEHLARSGGALRAGDIVMTGNLVTTKFPEESCAYRFEIKGLGAVEMTFELS